MIRRPPRSTQSRSSAASDVYKRQAQHLAPGCCTQDLLDTPTHRHTHIHTDIQTHRHTHRHTHTDRHTDTQTHRRRHCSAPGSRMLYSGPTGHAYTQTHTHTHRHTDTQTHTQTQTLTHTRRHSRPSDSASSRFCSLSLIRTFTPDSQSLHLCGPSNN